MGRTRSAWLVAAIGAAVIGLSAPGASANADVLVSAPHVLVHFSLPAGQQPENIALEPDGTADLTLAFIGQVVRVTADGTIHPLASLPAPPAGTVAPILGAPFTGGIVIAPDGSRYVNYSTGTAGLTGIWRLRPGCQPVRIAALPPTSFANGLALGDDGYLYAADSALGIIWRVPAAGGTPAAWASGPQLAPAGFIGANGLKVHDGAVWVTNTDQGTLLRIPIGPGGAAGPIHTVATGLAGVDDFTFARNGDILAALNTPSELAVIQPDGTQTIVLTSADGLSNPTAVAEAGNTIYITSAAYITQNDPNLLLARLTS
jgi:DNA-binding beta-propeller fold protein YncE